MKIYYAYLDLLDLKYSVKELEVIKKDYPFSGDIFLGEDGQIIYEDKIRVYLKRYEEDILSWICGNYNKIGGYFFNEKRAYEAIRNKISDKMKTADEEIKLKEEKRNMLLNLDFDIIIKMNDLPEMQEIYNKLGELSDKQHDYLDSKIRKLEGE